MKQKRSICMVLVTFNRKALLKQLLHDLQNMTVPIQAMVLVDNHSTDGTFEMLQDLGVVQSAKADAVTENKWGDVRVCYYQSSVNTGGSGGFAKAFEIAEKLPYDYIWAMDDDVSPEPDCLEKLLGCIGKGAEMCIPNRADANWVEYAVVDYNLRNPFMINLKQYKTKIESSKIRKPYVNVVDMPLEGPLMTMRLARRIGTPDQNYFIMYDDTDFAHRASEITHIRFVTGAVLHRRLAKREDPDAEPAEWTWKEYYLLRNSFCFDRKYGKNVMVRYFRPWLSAHAKVISAKRQKKPFRAKLIRRAYRDAVNGKMGKTLPPGTDIVQYFSA